MGSYKKIGLSHEMGLIDTPPLLVLLPQFTPNIGTLSALNFNVGKFDQVDFTVFYKL